MALSVAVKLQVDVTGLTHEMFEYPADIDALDDVVLEHLVTNGKPYKMFAGAFQITQQDLDRHAQSGAILQVCVVVEKPKTPHSAKLVLKLVNSRPLQKHELPEFPEDLDELDDVVLNKLVKDGTSFALRVDGEILTDASYLNYKRLGSKVVVHVSTISNPAQAAMPPVALKPGTRQTGGSPQSQQNMQELHLLSKRLVAAQSSAYADGTNVLVVSMEAESQLFKKIKADADAVVSARDCELALEAKSLIKEMSRVFDAGLTETLSTRKTIGHAQKICTELGDAFAKGKTDAVQLQMAQFQRLADKLEYKSQNVAKMLEDFQDSLSTKFQTYAAAEKKYRGVQKWSAGGAVVSGGGATACGGGAAAVGLVTEGTAAIAGYLGTSWGAVAATPAAWNPIGIALLAGCGLLAVVACYAGAQASSNGAAKEQMGQMKSIVQKGQTVGTLNADLWNGVSKHLKIACEAADDLSTFKPEQLQLFGEAFISAAESLAVLEKAVDEYLVYLSVKQMYPINFKVESVVGAERCKQIKDEFSIRP